ncbi:MAG: DUF4271 domain-containing protein [Paludibacteraceae bacterium]|nr:DUF4271 domain-containing protein [Paludibacteraceae bacterium]
MLGILLLAVSVQVLQPGIYVRVFRSLPTTKERDSIFVGSGSDIRSNALLVIYSIVLGGLVLEWLNYTSSGSFGWLSFLRLCGCAAGALALRSVMQLLVRAVFFSKNQVETYERHYFYLNVASLLLMYPIMLLALFTNVTPIVPLILIIILLSLCAIGLIYKTISLLPLSLYSILTLPLYLLTVEVLPIAAMVWFAKIIY